MGKIVLQIDYKKVTNETQLAKNLVYPSLDWYVGCYLLSLNLPEFCNPVSKKDLVNKLHLLNFTTIKTIKNHVYYIHLNQCRA